MSSKVEAIVKPELLVWARESAGLTLEDAARKAALKIEKLESCERGEQRLTISQLRSLAKVYKRPLAVFYLPKPPRAFDALRDFRRLPGEIESSESPQLRIEIRRAVYRRKVAVEMFSELGVRPEKLTATASLTDDPEAVAKHIRHLLPVSFAQQVGFSSSYDALNRWRAAIESVGVLVFQAKGIRLEEMRGFSIGETILPVIVVNRKDLPQGRIFTMFHEFTHLMLRQAGLCDLGEKNKRPEERKVETFCNKVAGAALVPRDWLLAEQIVSENKVKSAWSDEALALLASRFHVSREVILRRLLTNNLTTEDFYRRKRDQFQGEYESRQKSEGGFSSPPQEALSLAGTSFVQLVLNSYYQEKITSSDVSDFLEVRLRHLPAIEKAVQNRVAEFGAVS